MGDSTVVTLIPRNRPSGDVRTQAPARVIPMARKAAAQPMPAVAGSGWYHDAAIAESPRPHKG